MWVLVVGLVVHVVPALWRVHLGQVVRLFGASGPAGGWLWSSCCVFPPFVCSLALLLVRCPQIWLYFAF